LKKKIEEGFTYQIELLGKSEENDTEYFYVIFCNEEGCLKNYKIVF